MRPHVGVGSTFMAGKAYFKATAAPAVTQRELRCFKTVMLAAIRSHKDGSRPGVAMSDLKVEREIEKN